MRRSRCCPDTGVRLALLLVGALVQTVAVACERTAPPGAIVLVNRTHFTVEVSKEPVEDGLQAFRRRSLRKGLIDRSISLLEDAHAAAPELPEAQLHLALAYREAGRTHDALRLLSELQSRGGAPPELRAEVHEALTSLP